MTEADVVIAHRTKQNLIYSRDEQLSKLLGWGRVPPCKGIKEHSTSDRKPTS